MTPDETLLLLYNIGWQDESKSNAHKTYKKQIHQKAYDLGRMDAKHSDKIKAENKSEKEVLKIVKR